MAQYVFESTTRGWQRYLALKLPNWNEPISLWNFEGNLTNEINGGASFTTSIGNDLYVQPAPGILALHQYLSSIEANASELKITGDMTLGCIVLFEEPSENTTQYILAQGATSASENSNILYGLYRSAAGITWESENGAGITSSYTTTYGPPIRDWGVLMATRASNIVELSWNGTILGTSGVLTTPTGGANGVLSLGCLSGTAVYSAQHVSSLAIWDKALSSGQITEITNFVMQARQEFS